MRRIVLVAFIATALLMAAGLSSAADEKLATIKGQVVLPASTAIPKRTALKVTQDKDHCLSKGDLLDESVIVNPQSRGIKNVVVFLRPDSTNPKAEFSKEQIYAGDAQRKPAEVVIDQPCCMFINRITVARVGDTIVVKNSAPVAHNFFWDSSDNSSYNITVPKMETWKMPQPLKKENPPIQFKCTIHGWMTGYVRVFDHPYFAVTDENGNFDIKNVPPGKYRIVYWHENGLRGGAKGRFGDQIEVKAPVTDLKKVDFDVTPKN
jgi:hypothetical protein